ncbi:hypothetical protein SLS57_001663 [Botryosphaeria dothidea]
MAHVVRTLANFRSPFAVRGGGHMPIPDAANINSTGVLLASLKLRELELSQDASTVKVGAGNHWGDVYEYLEPYQLTVVGGRMGVVGVSGFVLGGGISFFGNQYGWASSNVAQYDCVLANGTVINAKADNEHADLFWALRGGGNSFAIVTAFHLKTVPLPTFAVGSVNYAETVSGEEFLDSVYNFAVNGSSDPKAHIVPMAAWNPAERRMEYSSMLFYHGDDTNPAALHNFTSAMEARTNTFRLRGSMHDWALEADPPNQATFGLRNRFYLHTIRAHREAVQVVHDTFLDFIATELSGVIGYQFTTAFMVIPESFALAAQANGGDPAGLDPSRAPYIWVQEVWTWTNPADDALISSAFDSMHARIEANLDELLGPGDDDVRDPFIHLNHADYVQPVFEGYPNASLARLREVRDKYDPDLVFTELMDGGWKFFKAYSGE